MQAALNKVFVYFTGRRDSAADRYQHHCAGNLPAAQVAAGPARQPTTKTGGIKMLLAVDRQREHESSTPRPRAVDAAVRACRLGGTWRQVLTELGLAGKRPALA